MIAGRAGGTGSGGCVRRLGSIALHSHRCGGEGAAELVAVARLAEGDDGARDGGTDVGAHDETDRLIWVRGSGCGVRGRNGKGVGRSSALR